MSGTLSIRVVPSDISTPRLAVSRRSRGTRPTNSYGRIVHDCHRWNTPRMGRVLAITMSPFNAEHLASEHLQAKADQRDAFVILSDKTIEGSARLGVLLSIPGVHRNWKGNRTVGRQ